MLQTGLLFADEQWGYQDAKEESVTFPVAVNSVIVIFRIPLRYLEQEAKYNDFSTLNYTTNGYTASVLSDKTLNHNWILIAR